MGDINTNIRIDEVIKELEKTNSALKSLKTKVDGLPSQNWVKSQIANVVPTFTFSKRLEYFPYTMSTTELYDFTAAAERIKAEDKIPAFKISVTGFSDYYFSTMCYCENPDTANTVCIIEFMKEDTSKIYVKVNMTSGYTELLTTTT